jgi:hypothetical protein
MYEVGKAYQLEDGWYCDVEKDGECIWTAGCYPDPRWTALDYASRMQHHSTSIPPKDKGFHTYGGDELKGML